jgi:hypothetical protein
MIRSGLVCLALILAAASTARAQLAPEVGYVYPPGGKAGTTAAVHLGGAEWTPDMQFFVHHPSVKLEVLGPPGELMIPPPPYWFGAKGRLSGPPLLRELPARFIIPADVPPGPVRWQAANANGVTTTGTFIIGHGEVLLEQEKRRIAQALPKLPITVSGRLVKNEEVDRYSFTADRSGPITCELMARRLGSNFNGVLDVRDRAGNHISEAVDTEGHDPILTFAARAGEQYTIAVRDIDHAGDRSFTYLLALRKGPRVVATLPAVLERGKVREVEFLLDIGGATPEAVKKQVQAPVGEASSFVYQLEVPAGKVAHTVPLGDLPEFVNAPPGPSSVPFAVTAACKSTETRYSVPGKKGDRWTIAAEARRHGSPLDLKLRVLGPDGKELALNDDLPGTTDAGLDFTVPADGIYQIGVADMAGVSGTPGAIHRLSVRHPANDFRLVVAAQKVSIHLGEKAGIVVKATRTGNFKGPIKLMLTGVPAGVKVTADLTIPADKPELAISLEVAADAATIAATLGITGIGEISGKSVTRTALASAGGNLCPRCNDEMETAAILFAITMKPRVKGAPIDKDTVRKVHRGSTHPAEVTIERLEGYTGQVMLRQAARQSYQVQGITGRDVPVPPGVNRAAFPCFMPEWLETTRTSRMGIVAEIELADPKGKVRRLVAPISGFVTMTMEGGLLKLSHSPAEIFAPPGEPITVRIHVARSLHLTEPLRLELQPDEELGDAMKAEPLTLGPTQAEVEMRLVPSGDPTRLLGERTFTIRGTAVKAGNLPVISETTVRVIFTPVKR